MDDLAELKAMCEALRTECIKFFEEGNKTAGTRARKMLQQVKGKAQELRVAIQERKRAMDLVKFEQEQAGGGSVGVGGTAGNGMVSAQEGLMLQSEGATTGLAAGGDMEFEGASGMMPGMEMGQ